jgi:hypothetical protein
MGHVKMPNAFQRFLRTVETPSKEQQDRHSFPELLRANLTTKNRLRCVIKGLPYNRYALVTGYSVMSCVLKAPMSSLSVDTIWLMATNSQPAKPFAPFGWIKKNQTVSFLLISKSFLVSSVVSLCKPNLFFLNRSPYIFPFSHLLLCSYCRDLDKPNRAFHQSFWAASA